MLTIENITEFYNNDGYGELELGNGYTIQTWNEPDDDGEIDVHVVTPDGEFTDRIVYTWNGYDGMLQDSITLRNFIIVIASEFGLNVSDLPVELEFGE